MPFRGNLQGHLASSAFTQLRLYWETGTGRRSQDSAVQAGGQGSSSSMVSKDGSGHCPKEIHRKEDRSVRITAAYKFGSRSKHMDGKMKDAWRQGDMKKFIVLYLTKFKMNSQTGLHDCNRRRVRQKGKLWFHLIFIEEQYRLSSEYY